MPWGSCPTEVLSSPGMGLNLLRSFSSARLSKPVFAGVLGPGGGWGVPAREGRGCMVSSAHLPVPDVGGQHLVLLILQEEEDTVSAQGVLEL